MRTPTGAMPGIELAHPIASILEGSGPSNLPAAPGIRVSLSPHPIQSADIAPYGWSTFLLPDD